MKKSEYYEALGILFIHDRGLYDVIARSPLSNVPKPVRRELGEDEKKEKRTKENQRYHNMSPSEKKKKAEKVNEQRARRNRQGYHSRDAIELRSISLI